MLNHLIRRLKMEFKYGQELIDNEGFIYTMKSRFVIHGDVFIEVIENNNRYREDELKIYTPPPSIPLTPFVYGE